MLFSKVAKKLMVKYENGSLCGSIAKKLLAQKYVSDPLLLDGHKVEFRMYHLIASTNPLIVYAYSRSKFVMIDRARVRKCANLHIAGSKDKSSYVCNSAVYKKSLHPQNETSNLESEEQLKNDIFNETKIHDTRFDDG